ncbi:MAG: hypothetical protein AB7H77_02010 [Bdellovibrionales bacterium]
MIALPLTALQYGDGRSIPVNIGDSGNTFALFTRDPLRAAEVLKSSVSVWGLREGKLPSLADSIAIIVGRYNAEGEKVHYQPLAFPVVQDTPVEPNVVFGLLSLFDRKTGLATAFTMVARDIALNMRQNDGLIEALAFADFDVGEKYPGNPHGARIFRPELRRPN